MKVSEAFSGNFLKAADLPQPKVFTIVGTTMESMPDQTTKPAIRFQGENRGFILNKTNALEIASFLGDDTAGWTGQQVELFQTTTFFGGRHVPAIRCRRPLQQPVPQQYQPQPVPQPVQYQQPIQQPVPQVSVPQQQPVQYQQPQVQQAVQQPPVQAPADDWPVDA